MLTDHEIKDELSKGSIKIEPYNESQVEAGNYRVHLGSKILLPKKGLRVSLNQSNEDLYDEFDLTNQSYILKPKELILGGTNEKIGLSKEVAVLLDGRSTLARLGVSIHQSAQYIHPGQDPEIITLEIFNAGDFEVELTKDMKIGKLLFFKFNSPNDRAYKEYGTYKDQEETTGAILH